jgi:uncharacterized protein YbjQ (UPF0145 family)
VANEQEVPHFSLPDWGTEGAPALNVEPEPAPEISVSIEIPPPAAEGWSTDEEGRPIWRTVVTSTDSVSGFTIASHLGLTSADVAVAAAGDGLDERLGWARERATAILTERACSRGAHAVVGLRYQLSTVGLSAVVSAFGTAVTLRPAG